MALNPDWTYIPAGSNPPDTYASNHYSEAQGSGDVSTSPGSPGVTRQFYIPHNDISEFFDDLLGYAIYNAGTGKIARTLPDPHPVYVNLYAVEATATGVGKLGQYPAKYAQYAVGKVTSQYRSLNYEVLSDDPAQTNELYRFVTRQYGFGGDAITINSTGMKFVSNVGADGKHLSLSQPPARPTMTMDLIYTWNWVPANPATSAYIPPNLTAIKNCYGKVNSTAFDVSHMNCPAGTVLFLGVDPKFTNYRIATQSDADPNLYWEVALRFLYRDNGFVNRGTGSTAINEQAGHNFIWDQAKAWWDLITVDGTTTGGRLLPSADLNTLFTIG